MSTMPDTERLLGAFDEGIASLKTALATILVKQDDLTNQFMAHRIDFALVRQSLQDHMVYDEKKFTQVDNHIATSDTAINNLQTDAKKKLAIASDRKFWVRVALCVLSALEGDSLTGSHLHKIIAKVFGLE